MDGRALGWRGGRGQFCWRLRRNYLWGFRPEIGDIGLRDGGQGGPGCGRGSCDHGHGGGKSCGAELKTSAVRSFEENWELLGSLVEAASDGDWAVLSRLEGEPGQVGCESGVYPGRGGLIALRSCGLSSWWDWLIIAAVCRSAVECNKGLSDGHSFGERAMKA